MEFKYLGKDERVIPALDLTLQPGETFEATGDAAQGLLHQTDLFKRTDAPTKEK